MRTTLPRTLWVWALLLLIITQVQAADDLETRLPPPPNNLRAPTSEQIIDNGDGTYTFVQVIDENSTPPNYINPGAYGFEIYSYFNEDYGWMHTFPFWDDPNLLINEATLTIVAWDVDSEPEHGYEGEYDGIHVDGTLLDPGYLQGNNNTWSITNFNIQMSSIIDDGSINVWCDIDMHHNYEVWATTLDYCEMRITYTLTGTNTAPYEPDLVVSPNCPADDDDLVVQIVGPNPADPNGDDVTYQYEWFVDIGTGQYIEDAFAGRGEHDGPVVPNQDTVNGDLWRVQVRSIDEHGAIGNYSTVTWVEPIGCTASDLEILDAIPASLGVSVVNQSILPETVATGGIPRNICVADGTSRLFLRYTSDRPGTLNVQVIDTQYPSAPLGSMTPMNSMYDGTTVSSSTYETSEGSQAFVVFTPPASLFLTQNETSDTRTLTFSVIFEPDDGSPQQELEESIALVRPPLVFVHGIWSGVSMWSDAGHYSPMVARLGTTAEYVDYTNQTHIGFNALYPRVKAKATNLINSYQRRGIACVQVQVVAHSMGGVLTRTWMAESGFFNNDNYQEGWVDMLLTIDTPHHGSGFADYYTSKDTWFWRGCHDIMNRIKPYGQSVRDLNTYSPAILSQGASPTRAHAFVGVGGNFTFAGASGALGWINLLSVIWPYCFSDLHPPFIFGSEDHDYIVQQSSQEGGLSSLGQTVSDGVAGEHTEAPDALDIANEIERILELGQFSGSIIQNGFPAPSGTPSAIPAGSSAPTEEPRIVYVDPAASSRDGEIIVLSPTAGSSWPENAAIPIHVDFGAPVTGAMAMIGDEAYVPIDNASGMFEWTPEPGLVGAMTLEILATTEDGLITSDPLTFTIVPSAPFVSMAIVTPQLVVLRPGETSQIMVTAETAAGNFVSVSSGALGTTYEVANTSVTSVDADGLATATGPGTTSITVRNGEFEAVVEFEVLYAVPNDPPVSDPGGPYEICVGEILCLDASASYDLDGTPFEQLGFEWDLDGDGLFDEATSPAPCISLLSSGAVTISLRVTDVSGAQSVASTTVIGLDCGPVIDQVDPEDPAQGDEIEIMGRLFGPDPGPGNRSTDTHNIAIGGLWVPDPDVLAWEERSIILRIPAGTMSGDIVVTADSETSNPYPITILGGYIGCLWTDATTGPLADERDGHGIAWGDFDDDGDQDLFLANAGWNVLLRNDLGGVFYDTDLDFGYGDSRAAAWGDYDGDGDLDLYLVNMGSDNALFRNDGGVFEDVTTPALAGAGDGNGCAWADYDNDGRLDLVVVNETGPNTLLHNEDGVLTPVAGSPVAFNGLSRGCAFGDYDDDGDLDLYVTVKDGANRLFRNDGAAGFMDVSGSPVNDDGDGKGCAWADYDNDGDLDLYAVNQNGPNRLFRNDGSGWFEDAADPVVADDGDGRTAVWGDYDNDGWLDLFVSNYSTPNKLYHNLGDGSFADSTCGALASVEMTAWGAGFADQDLDGDLDLYVSNHTWTGAPNRLFANARNSGKWLEIVLRGEASNRRGVGAKVEVTTLDGVQTRHLGADAGYMAQQPDVVHVGLGEAASAVVRVTWPSGLVQEHSVTGVEHRITITEGAVTGVETPDVPLEFALSSHPNPFNPSTEIRFALPEDARVTLEIFDVTGRLVRTLAGETAYPAGIHHLTWDGRDRTGRATASGLYFARIQAGDHRASQRLVLLK